MWEKISATDAGYRDSDIIEYIEILEKNHLATHNVILAKGDKIFYEGYWAPFHKDFMHRMYSVTKSIIAIAIGFAQQDGLLNIYDKICDYFDEYITEETPESIKEQTIREMLTMSTTREIKLWFDQRCDDRVSLYFENGGEYKRPSGTVYRYDSAGSFVLGALIERLTGKTVMEYLYEKAFKKIGVSENAHMLKCPGGHSWGDSALLCTPRDMLKIAHFTMNLGKFNGEQLLNEEYLKEATSKVVDNNTEAIGEFDRHGYGYQIWKTYGDAFFFNGMGCQFAICVPHKDLILIYNGDNQGVPLAKSIIIDNFFRIFVDNKPCGCDGKDLAKLTDSLSLLSMWGDKENGFADVINNKEYILDDNPMGITKIKLVFNDDEGTLFYTNSQGDKALKFGMCKNVFSLFPQTGYSKLVGSVTCPGHQYKCATSAAWVEKQKFIIKCQIIDDYFGNLNITLGFKDNQIGIQMVKTAEDFLAEYEGYAGGKTKE